MKEKLRKGLLAFEMIMKTNQKMSLKRETERTAKDGNLWMKIETSGNISGWMTLRQLMLQNPHLDGP